MAKPTLQKNPLIAYRGGQTPISCRAAPPYRVGHNSLNLLLQVGIFSRVSAWPTANRGLLHPLGV